MNLIGVSSLPNFVALVQKLRAGKFKKVKNTRELVLYFEELKNTVYKLSKAAEFFYPKEVLFIEKLRKVSLKMIQTERFRQAYSFVFCPRKL